MQYQKWEKGLLKEKVVSASNMPASQLVQAYRDGLGIDGNPLTEIYEKEILHRLWGYENSRSMIKAMDRFCLEEMASCTNCDLCS